MSSSFADVFTGNTKTVKRALTAADIQHLDKLKLEKNQKLQFVRDMFLFCVYAMGMPFVDVAHLLKSQIHGEVIEYARQKTGKVIHVHIEGCMKEIMDRYNDPSSKFVFPILKGVQDISETTENHKLRRNGKTDLDIQYVAALKKYNRLLKVLGNMIGLNVPLTSYMARHTWTSEAYRNYVNIYVISQALGHSSPVTTQIYIKGICNDEVFAANKWLLQTIKKAPLHKRCHSKSLSFIISPQRYV
jgi:integrase/recombinase XerD